ncbi:huntingtin-interacting protein K-like [Pteronotus mesoamericanus]|uniref:huntingtin-interacting protein K-like n=1 Tax=Pteronotus mesoamericanus TaxID=1884717 RepID=UPI0023EAC228|nr:huntingtin-interacting protein K-like [Pteronotus parnellii mesoamericanus]XP_054436381.1 huntingtin-interacting protein K-like [Pteronotus parnellii mesoamericanus]
MATEGDVELELETETSGPERPPEKPRKHDSGAVDLERVTDYVEEKEIQSSSLETAMSVIGDRRSWEQKAKQEWEKELAKVTTKKEDLLWMTQMGISRAAAEQSLREHMGNVVEALTALTN